VNTTLEGKEEAYPTPCLRTVIHGFVVATLELGKPFAASADAEFPEQADICVSTDVENILVAVVVEKWWMLGDAG
jgi:hypothetical protein